MIISVSFGLPHSPFSALFIPREVAHKAQAFAASDFGESDHSLYFVTCLYCSEQFSSRHFTNLLNSSESLYFERRLELASLGEIKNTILLCQVNFNATNSIPRANLVGIRRSPVAIWRVRLSESHYSPPVLLDAAD